MSDRFHGLRVPPPAPELRERVLAAARAAALQPRPHWIDRLYEDVTLRRAALALVVALLALLVLDLAPQAPVLAWQPRVLDEEAPPADTPGAPAAEQWPEVARELGLAENGG